MHFYDNDRQTRFEVGERGGRSRELQAVCSEIITSGRRREAIFRGQPTPKAPTKKKANKKLGNFLNVPVFTVGRVGGGLLHRQVVATVESRTSWLLLFFSFCFFFSVSIHLFGRQVRLGYRRYAVGSCILKRPSGQTRNEARGEPSRSGRPSSSLHLAATCCLCSHSAPDSTMATFLRTRRLSLTGYMVVCPALQQIDGKLVLLSSLADATDEEATGRFPLRLAERLQSVGHPSSVRDKSESR